MSATLLEQDFLAALAPPATARLTSPWAPVASELLAKTWAIIQPLTAGTERLRIPVGTEYFEVARYGDRWCVINYGKHDDGCFVGSMMAASTLLRLLRSLITGAPRPQ